MTPLPLASEPAQFVERLFAALTIGGGRMYFGEAVTQLEHALQTAALAEQSGAPHALVAAALLHDLGHLLHGMDEDVASRGIDAHHEDVAGQWLSSHFGPAITEPIRLHVAAKRYLCTVDAGYAAALSEASRESLVLQGGVMSPVDLAAFEQMPWAPDATALRRWDDAAKVPGLCVPVLETYRRRIEGLVER